MGIGVPRCVGAHSEFVRRQSRWNAGEHPRSAASPIRLPPRLRSRSGADAALFVRVAASSLMTPVIANGLLGGLLYVAAESYVATASSGTFRMLFAGDGPPEFRMLLRCGRRPRGAGPSLSISGHRALLLDVGGTSRSPASAARLWCQPSGTGRCTEPNRCPIK
jgi:hypothetical protein